MKRSATIIILFMAFCLVARAERSVTSYVAPFMGSGGDGHCMPLAAVPFGMVEAGPDSFTSGSGYYYSHNYTFGFSHTHKNGGGGTDFQDILMLPVGNEVWNSAETSYPALQSKTDHRQEHAEPGYYQVRLLNFDINAELTATSRCVKHRYTYSKNDAQCLAIDLKFGSTHSCTILPEEDFDTVKISHLEIVDAYTVRGYRISNGWCPEQHVYFCAQLSKPIKEVRLYDHRQRCANSDKVDGTDCRALIQVQDKDGSPLEVSVGISPVSMDGAQKNLKKEIGHKNFDAIKWAAHERWEKELSVFNVETPDEQRKQVFYTCLYFALLYPQLYSDVDGHFRSSDRQVYKGKYNYYAGVLGLWDTFRAQNPLLCVLHPEVTRDLMKTFLDHYRHCGQLPIWTLAGQENMCMIGYHAMPVIADAYAKGIRGFNVRALYEAMKMSACRDTFGYFLKDYRGARNYLKYHYVPSDIEITSVSKTLEYCYDDWCIAQMARMLGEQEDYKTFMERSSWYKNLFDKETGFMRGKKKNGDWVKFDPFMGNHYRPGDDYCEGTAWQWIFFVPHDGEGLIREFGSKERFVEKLDSLFVVSSELHGDHVSADIAGLIGQYAHGNEPSHHTIYMYNYAHELWKTQQRVSQVMYTMYNTSPEGMCGQEDTGQMSAWYIFSAMGFYPVTHGDGRYFIGTPLFPCLTLKHNKGTLKVTAQNVSRTNCYIQSLKLNGHPYKKYWLNHDEIFKGNVTLEFVMGPEPNKTWFD